MLSSCRHRLPPVDPLARRPTGDRHRQLLDPRRRRRTRGAPASGRGSARRRGRGSRCAGARRATPRAAARTADDALGDVEHVGELEGGDQLGVERCGWCRRSPTSPPRSCSSRSVSAPLASAVAGRGRCRRRPPWSCCISPRIARDRARRRGAVPQQVALEPAPLVGGLRRDRRRRRAGGLGGVLARRPGRPGRRRPGTRAASWSRAGWRR